MEIVGRAEQGDPIIRELERIAEERRRLDIEENALRRAIGGRDAPQVGQFTTTSEWVIEEVRNHPGILRHEVQSRVVKSYEEVSQAKNFPKSVSQTVSNLIRGGDLILDPRGGLRLPAARKR